MFLSIVGAVALGATLSPYIGIASFAFFLMVLGLVSKRNSKVHIVYMLSAMSLDVGLVLFLEVTRSAIEKVVAEPMTFLQRLHVGTSLTAMLLYIPTVILGFRLFRGLGRREISANDRARRNHRAVAIMAFVLRLVGFLAMFSMLPNSPHSR